jgi:hypothetical protein
MAAGRPGKGGEGAAVERGRLAAAQADLVALKVASQRGELLDAGAVEREWGGHIASRPICYAGRTASGSDCCSRLSSRAKLSQQAQRNTLPWG